MDLIAEYYGKRDFNMETHKKYELKRKKIHQWQKKIKIKANTVASVISSRKLKDMKSKLSKVTVTTTNLNSDIDLQNMKRVSVAYNDALVNFNAATKEEACVWQKSSTSQFKNKTNIIDKYHIFHTNIRDILHKSYKQNFPDSLEVMEEVLNLMFDTVDSPFKQTIKVITEQISVVPDVTAKYLNVKSSLCDKINKLIEMDFKIDRKFKTNARSNDFKTRWQRCSKYNVNYQNLESFETVWKNITHLQTTRKFCSWLLNNPNIIRPTYLENEGLIKKNLSLDYSATSDSMYYEYIAPEEIIFQSKKKHKKISSVGTPSSSAELVSTFSSVDISDINIIV